MDPQRYYDEFSHTYEHGRDRGYHAMLDALEASVVEKAIDRLHPPARAGVTGLEVGCGTGLIMARLHKRFQRLCGVDLSPGMLSHARARGFEVECAPATNLPYPDGGFDVVYSFKVLPHVEDIAAALREMVRVTRPGGFVVAEFYNPLSLRGLVKRLKPATNISGRVHDTDVFTRFDTPRQARGHFASLPVSFEFDAGVRVLTPTAAIHRAPAVGTILRRAEGWAAHSPLRQFAGFYICAWRKPG
ncbi:MAG: Ubiquinone/menaquinone biosynthesis C-methyltransferase UbiE [Myxococcota bacterium]|nr:Ubiquinone/menaquinone biosynthesis C-methyltransferase UbiE [Myxococcota bacterium]